MYSFSSWADGWCSLHMSFSSKTNFPCSTRLCACSNAWLFSLTAIGQIPFFILRQKVFFSSLYQVYVVNAVLSSIYIISSTIYMDRKYIFYIVDDMQAFRGVRICGSI